MQIGIKGGEKMTPEEKGHQPAEVNEDRRKFLASCGKFAAVTPPAITMLLSTSLSSEAVAASGGGGSGPRPRPRPPWWWWPF